MTPIITESNVQHFFERYQRFFMETLSGNLNTDELPEIYTAEFIAASPAGVRAGMNDDVFMQVMTAGYEHYRAIGTKSMTVRHIRLSPIDERHAVATVTWTAVYIKDGHTDINIDFEVHYLIQGLDEK
jgi:hypothetical protein